MKKLPSPITLSIAGCIIEIKFEESPSPLPYERNLLIAQIQTYYSAFTRDYSAPDWIISLVDERHFSVLSRNGINYVLYNLQKKHSFTTFYHISLSQFNLIILIILQSYLIKKGFILHASASLVGNMAHIFTGPSGAGKSTIARLLSPQFLQLADDSVIIRREGKKYYLYQTPMIEKNIHLFSRSSSRFPIHSIYFLTQNANDPSRQSVFSGELVIQKLLAQLWTTDKKKTHIPTLLMFASQKNLFYDLSFPKNKKVVDLMKKINKT